MDVSPSPVCTCLLFLAFAHSCFCISEPFLCGLSSFFLLAGHVVYNFRISLEQIKFLPIHLLHKWYKSPHTMLPSPEQSGGDCLLHIQQSWSDDLVHVMVTWVQSSVNSELFSSILFNVGLLHTRCPNGLGAACTSWLSGLSSKNTGHPLQFEFQMSTAHFFFCISMPLVLHGTSTQKNDTPSIPEKTLQPSCVLLCSHKKGKGESPFPFFKVQEPGIDLIFFSAPSNSTTDFISYS